MIEYDPATIDRLCSTARRHFPSMRFPDEETATVRAVVDQLEAARSEIGRLTAALAEHNKPPATRSPAAHAWVFSPAEIVAAETAGAKASASILEAVALVSTSRARLLDAAIQALANDGVDRATLYLERVSDRDEIRVMRRLYPQPYGLPDAVLLARVWTVFHMQTCKLTNHYEGPLLKDFTP